MKKIILLLLVIIMCSCEKESNKSTEYSDTNVPISLTAETGSFDFTNLKDELQEFWYAGLEDYSLQTFCNCDCNSALAGQDVFNNYHTLLPSIIGEMEPLELGCDELTQFMNPGCNYANADEYYADLDLIIEPSSIVTSEEKDLIMKLLLEIKEEGNVADITSYRQDWLNLVTNSEINNATSALMIEITAAADLFLPIIIEENGGVEPPQAILNKVFGAAKGAFASYWVDSFVDSFWGDNSYSSNEALRAMGGGAIAGAITSF